MSSPRDSPQIADPSYDDVQAEYDSYAVSDNPNVFVGTAPEVSDGAARRV